MSNLDNKIVVIGSTPLSQFFREFRTHHRTPKDLDLVMTYATYQKYLKDNKPSIKAAYPLSGSKMVIKLISGLIVEIECSYHDDDLPAQMIKRTFERFMNDTSVGMLAASLNLLYELKMSHRYLKNSPHFLKTMNDIHFLRKEGAVIEDQEFFKAREKETYQYAHPNLDVKKNEFFKDEAFYRFDHDTIHEAIKLGSQPAYKLILDDGADVKCSFDKWNALDHEQNLQCALEECYTLALERSLIPNDFKPLPRKAFDMALMKVCTSITSGWFREWCWENYQEISDHYEESFVKKFQEALSQGKIKPFKE